MKSLALALLLGTQCCFAQLTIDQAKEKTVQRYHIGASTYVDGFVGHPGYGAIVILTADGGAAAFGDGDEGTVLVKLTGEGTEKFKKESGAEGR